METNNQNPQKQDEKTTINEISINTENGIISLKKPIIEKESEHFVDNNHYKSISYPIHKVGEVPCQVHFHYKNNKLRFVYLTIEYEYLKRNYDTSNEIDFRDYIEVYAEYNKKKYNELISLLIPSSNKRNYQWGKIKVEMDPRDPFFYISIKYYK